MPRVIDGHGRFLIPGAGPSTSTPWRPCMRNGTPCRFVSRTVTPASGMRAPSGRFGIYRPPQRR
jgi:hypothetical protein